MEYLFNYAFFTRLKTQRRPFFLRDEFQLMRLEYHEILSLSIRDISFFYFFTIAIVALATGSDTIKSIGY